MIVILHPDQSAEVERLAREMGMDPNEVVRHLLSGPLLPTDGKWEEIPIPA